MIALTVEVIKSKDGNTAEIAVFGGSIIDVDSDDENDEVYLKICNPKPAPRVLKPKLTKFVRTTKTSIHFKGEKKKVTKLLIKLEEDKETVSSDEEERKGKLTSCRGRFDPCPGLYKSLKRR